MKTQTPSLKKWLSITNQIYQSDKPVDWVTCPRCQHQSLRVRIQPYPEGDVTLYFECLNCQLVDHISRMPVPNWLKFRLDPSQTQSLH